MSVEPVSSSPPIRSLLRALRAEDHAARRKVFLSWAAAVAGVGVIMLMAGLEFGRARQGDERRDFGQTEAAGGADKGGYIGSVQGGYAASSRHLVFDPALPDPRSHRRKTAKALPAGQQEAYCVRLCDGFYFPLGSVKTNVSVAPQESICSQLCPAAPTKLYLMTPGGDDIGTAVSARDNKLYSALPVALHHTLAMEGSCSCHQPNQASLVSMMNDFTLRAGDAVITREGVEVFRGSRHWPYQTRDFSNLAQARTPWTRTPTLLAIDRLMRLPKAARMETNQHFAAKPNAPAPDQNFARAENRDNAIDPGMIGTVQSR